MDTQDLSIVCQIQDFSLKIMVNKIINNKVQTLYKKNISDEQFSEKGIIISPKFVAEFLKKEINIFSKEFKINPKKVNLILPSDTLKIYESQSSLQFKQLGHKINTNDINQIANLSQNINIEDNEVICLTKIYNLNVDGKNYYDQFPIGVQSQNIKGQTLVYTIAKDVYSSHFETIKFAGYQVSSVILDQFALLFSLNNDKNNNRVIVDWNFDATKISVFSNSTLYAIKNIDIGFNTIIKALMKKMKCSYNKAFKYLSKIININNNYLNDLIIDKYYDNDTNNFINFTKDQLENIVRNLINEILENIEYFLRKTINIKENKIIFVGETINIPGFNSYVKNYLNWDNIFYINNNISDEWLNLMGASYFQNSLKLLLNKKVINNKNDSLSDLNFKNKLNNQEDWHFNINS